MSKHIKVKKGYLEYMRHRVNFNGRRNMRKIMILSALLDYDGSLPAQKLFKMAGAGCSYSAFRSALCRMAKYRYLNTMTPDYQGIYRAGTQAYSLAAKGGRLIYLCQQFAPDKYQDCIDSLKPFYTSARNRI